MASDVEPVSHQAVVIRSLVGALSDTSVLVRESAALSLLKDTKEDALVILDSCLVSLKTVKRRGGQVAVHRSSVLDVMAKVIQSMEKRELGEELAKSMMGVSLTELASNKDSDPSWQHAASSLLVALCCKLPNLVMEEVFVQLVGHAVPVLALVQSLADFSEKDALQFVPHMKGVLSRVLPLLGGIKDAQKKTFADAFACWCAAMFCYVEEHPSTPYLGPDMQALLHSAFDLFLGRWLLSRDRQVSMATVEALAQMFPLINKLQLKAALPKLLPAILSVYKKDSTNCFPVTYSLHMLLHVVLPGNSPMLDFQALISILNAILPMASIYSRKGHGAEASTVLKNFNEVVTCFVIIGRAFPNELFGYLMNRLNSKDVEACLGVFLILKHLLPRLAGTWADKRATLLDALVSSLQEQNLNSRKALAELIASMASVGFLVQENDQPFIEFLIKQSAVADSEVKNLNKQQEALENALGTRSMESEHNQLKMGFVSLSELRAVCDKVLFLLASTTPQTEDIMWPFLLKVLMPARYTEAVATVSKCICEILKRRIVKGSPVVVDYSVQSDVPRPEDILGRLIVLLQNPMSRNQLAASLLTLLLYLAPLFPTAIQLLWEDEIPKLKAYISDPEDMKAESWQQETWEEMMLHLLSESVDVISSSEWTMSIASSLTSHYSLYAGDHNHSAFLHRCLGVVLAKVDSRSFVREKIAVMYKQSEVADNTDRLGLAMGMGLVAASHLDTVLEKLKDVLEKESRRSIGRFLASFFDQKGHDVDNIYAALALMYGYAASYAPSTVIEARIDKLVGTNVLSRLLDVKSPAAKQAVITAINLLGQAVIKAASNGVPFPLKRRDTMLDYVMALMVTQGSSYLGTQGLLEVDSLHTQNLAINACTTLVSVEPKLTSLARDRILEATLRFYTLPTEPAPVVNLVLEDLTNLLCVILRTSGEDGKSRADQVHHLLNSLDQYISSQTKHHRERACVSVLAILKEFRTFCSAGAPLLPSRDALILGERVMMYLPRCADVSPLIRKSSAQIVDLLFSIALSLPKLVGSTGLENRQASYAALSSIEELIAVSKWESSTELAGTLQQIVSAVSVLLSNEEYVMALQCCNTAICDKVPQCGEGATAAVRRLILERGRQLEDHNTSTITQSLFKAATAIADVGRRQKILETVCCLAKETQPKLVMREILAVAVKEAHIREVVKHRGSWPVEEAFTVFANHVDLALPFLDYLVSVLDQTPVLKDDTDKNQHSNHSQAPHAIDYFPIAAVRALTTVFRVGGDPIRKALEQRYPTVFCALLLQLGGSHGTIGSDKQASRDIIIALKTFCRFVGDLDLENVVEGSIDELLTESYWIKAVGKIAYCVGLTHPKEIAAICKLLWPVLKRDYVFQRIAAAAALAEYVKTSNRGSAEFLEQLVGVLGRHIGDESPIVRRLCVQGLVQVPNEEMPRYAPQVLGSIVTLIDDGVEDVSYAAVQGLPMVLEIATEDTVSPVLINLCVRLRPLQARENVKMRAAAFAALEKLSTFATGPQLDAFLEQIHPILPRLILHMNDEAAPVRQACKTTFKKIAPLLNAEELKHLGRLVGTESDNRLYYDAFLKEITRHLVTEFSDRLDTYLSSAIQAFDAVWPRVQANSISFVAFMLSQLDDQRSSSIYVPQIVTLLMRTVETSPSQVVRGRSAWALGLLMDQVRSSAKFSGDVLVM